MTPRVTGRAQEDVIAVGPFIYLRESGPRSPLQVALVPGKTGKWLYASSSQMPAALAAFLPQEPSIAALTSLLISDAGGLRRARVVSVDGQPAVRLVTPSGGYLDVSLRRPYYAVDSALGPHAGVTRLDGWDRERVTAPAHATSLLSAQHRRVAARNEVVTVTPSPAIAGAHEFHAPDLDVKFSYPEHLVRSAVGVGPGLAILVTESSPLPLTVDDTTVFARNAAIDVECQYTPDQRARGEAAYRMMQRTVVGVP